MMQTVDMIIREVHAGLWFLVVGYYFFIFIFLLFFRWRTTRNPFQFAMAMFFLLLAVGRCFYFVGDFYADSRSLAEGLTPFLGDSAFWLMAGSFIQWMALATLSATAGFMIFGKRWAEIAFAVPAIIIGIILGFVPLETTTRGLLSGGAGAVYALFIPLLFWYLAWQSGGMLRRSNLLLGLGFFILFAGRVIHAIRYPMADVLFNSSIAIPGVIAPGLIVIGLILIATGNEWGQTA
ncbi:hypothetical protein EU527_05715 [Candidatus Thorarchaeota archaeon]|nr:MAG: hypothetical protein EU527_05715 [Candidatus Thorarchaeota archaeon]